MIGSMDLEWKFGLTARSTKESTNMVKRMARESSSLPMGQDMRAHF